MFSQVKHFFARILVLVMVISPIQVTASIDFDGNAHGKCAHSSMHLNIPDTETIKKCAIEHAEHCSEHSECFAQCSSVTLYPTPFLSLNTFTLQTKLSYGSDSVASYDFAPLKRPPRT